MRTGTVTFTARMVAALLKRPRLIPVALAQARSVAPLGWWRRPPFLPLPDRDYLAFRLETATGQAVGAPDVGETIEWLEWCSTMRAID